MALIREIKAGDLSLCAAVFVYTMNDEPWYEQWSPEKAQKYLGELLDMPNALCFVAEEEDEVVGAAFCRLRTWYSGSELYIEEMFVQTEYQRRGIGCDILAYLEEYAMENGIGSIALTTDRRYPAARFFADYGFAASPDITLMYKDVEQRWFTLDNDG